MYPTYVSSKLCEFIKELKSTILKYLFLILVGRRTPSADMLSQCGTCSEMIESSQQIIIFN